MLFDIMRRQGIEWKSTASGDYVIGLEPANSSVYGRPWHEARGSVHRLPHRGRGRAAVSPALHRVSRGEGLILRTFPLNNGMKGARE